TTYLERKPDDPQDPDRGPESRSAGRRADVLSDRCRREGVRRLAQPEVGGGGDCAAVAGAAEGCAGGCDGTGCRKGGGMSMNQLLRLSVLWVFVYGDRQ